jgi:hypothetical protein
VSEQIEDGGPAYPTTATATRVTKDEDGASVLTNYGSSAGMSLRDWFAGQALAGMLANVERNKMFKMDLVFNAYGYADAMLAARKEKP